MTVPAVALLLAVAAQDAAAPANGPAEATPTDVRLDGVDLEGLEVRLDLERGRIRFVDPAGEELVAFPVGANVRPSRPARRFVFAKDRVETLAGDDAAGDAVVAALLRLPRLGAEAETPVTVGVRAGPFGPLVTYSFPRRTFRGIAHRTSFAGDGRAPTVGREPGGRPVRVAGARAEDAVAVDAPARIRLLVGERFTPHPLGALRLRGAFGVDDASGEAAAAAFSVLVDGVDVGRVGEVRRGEPAQPFDVPLRDGREVTFAFDPGRETWETAIAVLVDARFEGPDGFELRIADVLHADRAGVELLVDGDGGFGGASLLAGAPEPDPERAGVSWIDASRTDGASVAPGPLLLPFEAAGGWLVGVGPVFLPDATRLGSDGAGVVVQVPTPLLASEPAENLEEEDLERLRLMVAVVAARSMDELYARYRSTLIAAGGSATRRVVGSLTVPSWWRDPLVYCGPPPGRGRFGRFDVHEIEKRVADVEERLGLRRFTVVVDGEWASRPGDPRPSDDFARLKVLTAAQHVKGRHVLLRWPLFAAAPGSLADVIGAQAGGRLALDRRKKVVAFLHEVVRACFGDGLHSLGADGFLLVGTASLGDPTRDANATEVAAGVGWRALATTLRWLREEVDRRELNDTLLAAPSAVPQLVLDQGAVVFDPATADPRTREERLERLVAVLPDLPILMRPLDEAPEAVLDWAARSVAIGVPAVGSRTLARLDADDARALGAILRLAAERPLGIPVRDGEEWRMEYDERVLARTLAGRTGVAVFPERGVALVALTRDGDARLPFQPVSIDAEDGASIEFVDGGVVLRGGRAGTVYRLRTE